MGFPPWCHRAQRLEQFQVQTNCCEGSRDLVRCKVQCWGMVRMLATMAGHLGLGHIASQGGTLLGCHLVGVPEVEASGSLPVLVLPLGLGQVEHLAPDPVPLPTPVEPDRGVDHVAVPGDEHQHQVADADEQDAQHRAASHKMWGQNELVPVVLFAYVLTLISCTLDRAPP